MSHGTGGAARRSWVSALVLVGAAGMLAACGDDGDYEHPEGIGNFCDEDADCPTDNCYLGRGGGYCTSECTNEGALEDECPMDTICKPIQGGPARCLLICGSDSACDGVEGCGDAFCPEGSSCVDISDSGGIRGCEPDPE